MELISVRKEDLEKLSMDFTPEMQEKVRQCKTMEELYAFFAENDVELSEDVLAAVSGGCFTTRGLKCTICGGNPMKYIRSEACYDGFVMAMFYQCPNCGRMHYTGHVPWNMDIIYGPIPCK